MDKESWDEYRHHILLEMDRLAHVLSDIDHVCKQISTKIAVVENEVKRLVDWTANKDKQDLEFSREQIRGKWSLLVAITAGILGLIGSLLALYLKKP